MLVVSLRDLGDMSQLKYEGELRNIEIAGMSAIVCYKNKEKHNLLLV